MLQFRANAAGAPVRASCSSSIASAWLVAPVRGETKMSNNDFAWALRNRLNMSHDQILPDMVCNCKLKCPIDKYGIHLQKCKNQWPLTQDTHNQQVSIIVEMLRASGYSTSTEPPDSFRAEDPTNNKRLDIIAECPDLGGTIGIDVVVTNAITNNVIVNSIIGRRGNAAHTAERKKHLKYSVECKAANITLFAAGSETQGTIGKDHQKLRKMIIKSQAKKFHVSTSVLRNYYNQIQSVTLQRSVAIAQRKRLDRQLDWHVNKLKNEDDEDVDIPFEIGIQEKWEQHRQFQNDDEYYDDNDRDENGNVDIDIAGNVR